jgi:alanine dehydrogenase
MNDPTKKFRFSDFFSEGQYQTQVETLEVSPKENHISIGIPKETILDENRIALVPQSVHTLVGYGHRVVVETKAGEPSNYTDQDFSEAGAIIAHSAKQVYECDLIVKAAPPTVKELEYFHPNQMLISPLQLPITTEDYLRTLKKKQVIAIAMEYLQAKNGTFPVVRIMSEMAGLSAMLTAADLLANTKGGRGVLLGGVSGVPPAKVVILGAGVVGEFATRAALGLGASVRVFDNDVYKLMRLQSRVGRQLHTSSLNPVYLAYQLTSADVIIGAVHSKTGRTPIIVTEEMVAQMKSGSVIIDVSIDQGGCFETSRVTTHKSPTFRKHDVIHYCVPNIASKVSRTSSVAVSNILIPFLLKIGSASSFERLLFDHYGIRNGVYTYRGCITNEYLSKRFDLKYTALELLLTSGL